MKATGIVRPVDPLGRVVIPVELRRNLGIKTDDSLEVFVDGEFIMLKKYEPACIFCGNAKDVQYAFDKLGHGAAIMAGRSVLYAWQRQDDGADHYQQYAREAALKMREQILGYITVL